MDVRRFVLALLAALVISVGALIGFLHYMRPSEEKVDIVATAKAIPAGSILAKDDLTVIKWPTSLKINGMKTKPEDLVGWIVLYPLEINEPVLDHDLAAPGSGIGLPSKIPSGMRAVSVRSNEVVGVAGFLYPGSHVDVLATFRQEAGTSPTTQTILQNVEVLTAGQRNQPDPTGKPETVNVVTLLLSPVDAEKLILATSQATIQFVLRSGADVAKSDTRPITEEELISGQVSKKPEPVKIAIAPRPRAVKKESATPKPPSFYTVEVINGDKKSESKF